MSWFSLWASEAKNAFLKRFLNCHRSKLHPDQSGTIDDALSISIQLHSFAMIQFWTCPTILGVIPTQTFVPRRGRTCSRRSCKSLLRNDISEKDSQKSSQFDGCSFFKGPKIWSRSFDNPWRKLMINEFLAHGHATIEGMFSWKKNWIVEGFEPQKIPHSLQHQCLCS